MFHVRQYFLRSLALLVLPLMVSCSAADDDAAEANNVAVAKQVDVSHPMARAVPPGQKNSAIFLTLRNNGQQSHQLVAASSDVAEHVELHTHLNEDGVMKMRQVPAIDLPADEMIVLKPGGLHIMLIGLKQDLPEGKEFQVTLEFSDKSTETIMVPTKFVKRPGGHGHKAKHTD